VRAFVYCRVSTQEQARDDHYSLANQEARCREYIKHKPWRCVKVLRDVASGKSAAREGYQELLGAIRRREVDVVVVYRLDRLSRNVRNVYDALDLSREQGVGFVSVQESFDTTTARGRAMLGVAAVFAQLTREMIAENVRDGLRRRAQAGKYTGGPHTRPYGYEYREGRLQVREEETQVVRRVFRLYSEQGWGLHRIARLLNAEGIRTTQGLQGRWGANAVFRMLRNPVYVGRVRHNGQEYEGSMRGLCRRNCFGRCRSWCRGGRGWRRGPSRAPTCSRGCSSAAAAGGIWSDIKRFASRGAKPS
jgi:site-specific DNA recombinase